MIYTDYITGILGRFEGKGYSKGYVPCKGGTFYGTGEKGEPFGASGVTIATGVDLGQQTKDRLKSMGVSEETIRVLSPYLGLKTQAAVDALRNTPLTITGDQVEEIDRAVHNRYINETAAMFGPLFEAAPKQVQAVAVSLHYQFGIPRRTASPGLGLAWDAMRKGDYTAAAVCLTDPKGWSIEHRQYLVRRQ
ncbi:MAG: pesticin C-terminus-like muramidase, partial [Treponema sp.]|nr:pesticin C-terminus-like muramidase [Treponema sp.]